METILKANRIQFLALDVATDEKARMLWGRRAGKKKLPGLVRMGMIVAVRATETGLVEQNTSDVLSYGKLRKVHSNQCQQNRKKIVYSRNSHWTGYGNSHNHELIHPQQDLPEVEEWNEYGEIKDNLSFAAGPSSQAPSTTSTPSKPPPSTSTTTNAPTSPSKLSTESTPLHSSSQPPTESAQPTENPITGQLRQLGIEAAQKASDAKSKARASLPKSSEPMEKPNNAGPASMPPPSGTTEAEDAKAPETGNPDIDSKADTTPVSEDQGGKDEQGVDEVLEGTGTGESAEVEHSHGTLEPAKAAAGHIKDEGVDGRTKALEEHGGLQEKEENQEDRGQAETAGGEEKPGKTNTEDVASATASATEDLPGKKTQEQAAAEGDEAGVSVGD